MSSLGKLAWVETKLVLRDPLTLVFTLAFPLIMLFVLAEVFGNRTDDREGELVFRNVGAIDYYVPAYVALVAAAVGVVALPVHLASYREQGVFRRFRAAGLRVWSLLAAELAVVAALAIVGGALVGLAAALAYDNRRPGAVIGVVGVFALVTTTFAALGVLLGAVLPGPRAAQGAGAILFFSMMMLGGAGPPPEVMSPVMSALADGLPLTHAVRLLQDPWLGFAWEWWSFLALLGFLVGSVALAARLFRWE